jgi:hypothetical protein
MKKDKELNIKDIILATIYLKTVDDKRGCIPEYHLHAMSKEYELPPKTCRKIRDFIQIDRLNTQYNS